eukprot:443980_1
MAGQVKIANEMKTSYSPETKITTAIWTIDNQHGQMSELDNEKYIESNQFETDKNIKWFLECYPNGHDEEAIGSCIPHLKLVSLPPEMKGITVYWSIQCQETYSCNDDIDEFTYSGDSNGWANKTGLTTELAAHQSITFNIKIRILQITNINDKIIYSFPLHLNTIKQKYEIKWNIDNNIIKTLRESHFNEQICG